MFKYLIILFLLVMSLIYFGNYMDHRKQRISRKEYDRRIRLFIALAFILIFVISYLRKK